MPDWLDWLIGYRVRDRRGQNLDSHLYLPLVQRCPQHVTKWSLCRAGIAETQANFSRIVEGRLRDDERLAVNPRLGRGFIYVDHGAE